MFAGFVEVGFDRFDFAGEVVYLGEAGVVEGEVRSQVLNFLAVVLQVQAVAEVEGFADRAHSGFALFGFGEGGRCTFGSCHLQSPMVVKVLFTIY